jgi:penicillin amidase
LQLVYSRDGTPGVLAADARDAYAGLGELHARHRPLQSLLLVAAAQGRLAELVMPRPDLVAIDTLVHRLELPVIGRREEALLDDRSRAWLTAYLDGFRRGLALGPLRLLFARVPEHSPATLISALMVSAFLGLAEGQARMERAILDALEAGADPTVLATMFAPHLLGLDRERVRGAGFGLDLGAAAVAGGSNAWAVTGARTASGHPMLCGDPHLQVNQLPALFFEVALRVGDDYWLGATIPGLPGIAVGRNKRVAWSGTFGVADNVDLTLDEPHGSARDVELRRRWQRSLRVRFFDTPSGVREGRVSTRWWGTKAPAECIAAYLRLPTAQSAQEASTILARAHTLSLHYVIADRSEILYRHVGHIPRGRGSGALVPLAPGAAVSTYAGDELPVTGDEDGLIATANEARLAPDGGVLATFAQPSYRIDRIREVLRGRRDHDVAAMQALQLDVRSLQAARLLPVLLRALPACLLRDVLSTWDFLYIEDSVGAAAFDRVYRAAVRSLAPALGGAWWRSALARTEISVWWCAGIDAVLEGRGPGAGFLDELDRDPTPLAPWGEVHQLSMPHMVFPGCGRGPFALPGSLATVRQGNNVPAGAGVQTTGPAYRFVTDLGEDCAYTTLAGGIDGSPLSRTYTRWLEEWRAGRLHRLSPP